MNEPVKCPDCGLWWRTDTHRCEEKKTEEKAVVPFVKSSTKKHHNARAYCLSCHKSGTVYFEHDCSGYNSKGYGTPHDTKTWVGGYKDYSKATQKEKENDPKKGTLYENKVKNSCRCGEKHK